MGKDQEKIEAAHYEWAKRHAEKSLNIMPDEIELRRIGIVPWMEAIQWRDQNPSPAVKGLVAAINFALENYLDKPVKINDAYWTGRISLKEALAAYEESLKK